MKYRIRLDGILDAADTITRDQIKNVLVNLKDKMKKINALETSSIIVEECHHDESPPQPCKPLYKWQKP